jgi:hypothetical protein
MIYHSAGCLGNSVLRPATVRAETDAHFINSEKMEGSGDLTNEKLRKRSHIKFQR